jgi:hypothetical protein
MSIVEMSIDDVSHQGSPHRKFERASSGYSSGLAETGRVPV